MSVPFGGALQRLCLGFAEPLLQAMTNSPDLKALRDRLDVLDGSLLDAIRERQQIIAAIGEAKRGMGKPLRDFAREKDVLDRAEANAAKRGLDASLAHELMKLLIQHSLTHQEIAHIRAQATGAGLRALVVGGAGQMGRWFASFLDSQGFNVEICDPNASADEAFPAHTRLDSSLLNTDLILVAAGLRASAGILRELVTMAPTKAVIIDIASIKEPLRPSLVALKDAGWQVASLHPMFGPSAVLLADRHVVVIDLGCPDATALARSLFANTTAVVSELSLDAHDRIMAEVLGLSHALNIAFALALAEGKADGDLLQRVSSSTFDAQSKVARRVLNENPNLYFEIQTENPNNAAQLDRLATALQHLSLAVAARDIDTFRALMARGRELLGPG
ncbi:bifunctional chorismate mutase/prephenate dehydrogenase [Ahniella affigens]|nr:bifunctional chorismate mutase/prephenate dehydrogenase [Ahniella affigens]